MKQTLGISTLHENLAAEKMILRCEHQYSYSYLWSWIHKEIHTFNLMQDGHNTIMSQISITITIIIYLCDSICEKGQTFKNLSSAAIQVPQG